MPASRVPAIHIHRVFFVPLLLGTVSFDNCIERESSTLNYHAVCVRMQFSALSFPLFKCIEREAGTRFRLTRSASCDDVRRDKGAFNRAFHPNPIGPRAKNLPAIV